MQRNIKMKTREFDWDNLAFGSKKELRSLNAIFIAAPREVSINRFTQLVREYLPKGNILLGIAKEDYIEGFDDQPQFKSLQQKTIASVVEKVNESNSPHSISILQYNQRYLKHILEKISFQHILLANGSWKYTFHTRAEYYTLVSQKASFEYISPFTDDKEARAYDVKLKKILDMTCPSKPQKGLFDERQMLDSAHNISLRSYDNSFQTGATLGIKQGPDYRQLITTWNKVVPFETFAMHNGTSRERNYSPPHDLNHYDTVHAEVELILEAQKQKIDLHGTTVFINLLPCPACARMLADTDISELVYKHDHSEGYAVAMLEASGKKVRRVVDKKVL